MKRLFSVLMLALCMLAVLSVPALGEGTDATTSASVSNFYGDYALTGDELMNAMNSFSGFYIISTTNPDGTPNSAFFIFGCKKIDDTYYLQLGLAENQSRENLLANGEGLAVYAAAPSGDEGAKPYAVAGARMRFVQVTDEEVLKTLNPDGNASTLYFEIVETRPLG